MAPKTHFKQLVNQPTLAKISLKLLITNPLILKIDNLKNNIILLIMIEEMFLQKIGDSQALKKIKP